MTHGFYELVIGDVLVAPFVTYAVAAAVLVYILRPVLRFVGFELCFTNPPVALLGLYVLILAALIVLV